MRVKSPYSFSVLSSAGLSDEGYAHKKNEDAWDIFELQSGAGAITIGIVADGVTSKAGGATASGLAIQTIRKVMASAADSIYDAAALQDVINDAIQKANRAILEEGRKNPEIGNMSTTLVLAAVGWGQLQLAYLGDSRVYLLRDGLLHRLTLDHTWAQEALDKGLIGAEELKTHPNRNVIRRFLGINRQIDIDRQILKPGHYHRSYTERDYTRSLTLHQNDLLLLCSDGLTERTEDSEIATLLSKRAGQPQRAVDELIQLALMKKEQDNITAVVLSLEAERKNASAVKFLGWSAALMALLVAAVMFYTFMQNRATALIGPSNVSATELNPDVVTVDKAAMVSDQPLAATQNATIAAESHSSTSAELSGNATQEATKDSDATSADKIERVEATEQQTNTISTVQNDSDGATDSLGENTVPFAETRAAKEAQERATAVALSNEGNEADGTAANTSDNAPIDGNDALRGAANREDNVAVTIGSLGTSTPAATATQMTSTPLATLAASVPLSTSLAATTTPTPKSIALASLSDQGQESEAEVQEDEIAPEINSSLPQSERLTVSRLAAQSTPTRKAQPTPEPTPTQTPSPVPTSASDESAEDDEAPSSDSLPARSSLSAAAPDAQVDVATEGVSGSQEGPSRPATDADSAGPAFDAGRLVFVLPPELETVRAGQPTSFKWITEYQLEENQTFEVVIWQSSSSKNFALEKGMGMVDVKHTQPTRVDDTTWMIETAPPRSFDAGEYKWAVLVVETDPTYKRVVQLGNETRKFVLTKERTGVRSSGKSNDTSGESTSGGCKGVCGDR